MRSAARAAGEWTHLTAEGWFEEAFNQGPFIWTPPPAASLVALEHMCEAKHIRPEGGHSQRVAQEIGEDSLRGVYGSSGILCVGKCKYEPIIVGLTLPFLTRRPWQIRHEPDVEDNFINSLCGLWPDGESHVRDHLCKLRIYV